MSKSIIVRWLLGLGMLFAAGNAAAQAPLRVALEGAYPPFSFIDRSGQVKGFDVDVARELCARLGRPCDLQVHDWDSLIPGLLTGKFDIIVASMTITPERAEQIAFTEPYYRNRLQFVAPKNMDVPFDVDTLKDLTIGVQRATVSAQWIEDNLGADVDVRLYPDVEAAFLDLTLGRLDVVLNDVLGSYDFLQRDEGQAYDYWGETVLDDDRIGIGLARGRGALKAELNEAITAMVADGTHARLTRQYFPFDIY